MQRPRDSVCRGVDLDGGGAFGLPSISWVVCTPIRVAQPDLVPPHAHNIIWAGRNKEPASGCLPWPHGAAAVGFDVGVSLGA